MSVIAVLPPSIAKEVRALAAPWLACVACVLVITLSDEPRLVGPLAVIAYLVGTVGLGALSIGHEYTGRTLSLLLTLPARRERLLATKLGVLAVMLLGLWVLAEALVFSGMPGPADAKQMISLIPLICGLFLAPWLTMACRSSIAGTVFALTIPSVLVVMGELLGVATYGHGPVMEAFRMTFVWFGTLGLCTIGAVMSWRMFMRLEAIEGRDQEVRLPEWTSASAVGAAAPHLTRHNPVWLLVKKELRLQQMSLVFAALYVLEWLFIVSLASVSNWKYGYLFTSLSFLHVGLLPLLIGSSASAGERQIGTLEWQVLLPMTAAKQWAVKVGVVFGLSIVLALGLPTVLSYFGDQILGGMPSSPFRSGPAMTIAFLLATGSLYVSSLCSTGLWALVMSLPVTVGSWTFLNVVLERVGLRIFVIALIPTEVKLLLVAGFIGIVLRFAFTNHRSADRPAARVWRQAIVMAAYVTAGVITTAAWRAVQH
jgi:hypothetical protein